MNLISIIEEQISVLFTGKINILSNFNRQYLGHLLFNNGELIQVHFKNMKGLKAFHQVAIEEYTLQSMQYIVEPEIVSESEREIHHPFGVIRNKLNEVIDNYQQSIKFKPPSNVKMMIDVSFLDKAPELTSEEFQILDLLTEWNQPDDIYRHSGLMDHEITLALVSLRKKGALKIIAPMKKPI